MGATKKQQEQITIRVPDPEPIAPVDVGGDIGYGFNKFAYGNDTIIFPSVLGRPHHIQFQEKEILEAHPNDQLTDEQGNWWVGDLAIDQLKTQEQITLVGRDHANEERLRLFKSGIARLFPSINNGDILQINLATGLPVKHMDDAPMLKELLLGPHKIKTDKADFVADVTNVYVMPQPFGTGYRHSLTVNGQQVSGYQHSKEGVLDIGEHTVDASLCDTGKFISQSSDSVESGMYMARTALRNLYADKYKETPSYSTLDTLLRDGKCKVFGEWIDFTKEVKALIDPVIAATLGLCKGLWRIGTEIDIIYVTGGPAKLIYPYIKAVYPQAVLVENSQFGNASGYLRYALWRHNSK